LGTFQADRKMTMKDDDEVGYGRPPTHSRWQKGQSGNPKGRPKSRLDIVADAAAILSEPVTAHTPDGRKVRLEAYEAAYLALCKKGLQDQKTSLLAAIDIMLDVSVVSEKEKLEDRERQQLFRKVGTKLGFLPADADD
jgi:hypothetical protein